jgi:hypothetical protein
VKRWVNIQFTGTIALDPIEVDAPAASDVVQAVQNALGYAGVTVTDAEIINPYEDEAGD